MAESAFQDLIPDNHCFGCGPANTGGLQLKSYWGDDGTSVARFAPQAHHCAGPAHFVNGGILATLADCHCVCTAMAAAYRDAGRRIGEPPLLYYATGGLTVSYLRPTPMAQAIELIARIERADARTYVLSCTVAAAGRITAEATVEAVTVPLSWMGIGQRRDSG